MGIKVLIIALVVVLSCSLAQAQNQTQPFSKLPREARQSLARRLNEYVRAYRSRDWKALYELVSDTGKGRVTRQTFVAAMKAQHGTAYADMPDLLEFSPERSEENQDGIDIYGCGKAKREGDIYTGIAVTHAVHEHNTWSFTGWSFTEFPNEPCKFLADSTWKPARRMEWDKAMEEIRDVSAAP